MTTTPRPADTRTVQTIEGALAQLRAEWKREKSAERRRVIEGEAISLRILRDGGLG